jgi:hypothetical protein
MAQPQVIEWAQHGEYSIASKKSARSKNAVYFIRKNGRIIKKGTSTEMIGEWDKIAGGKQPKKNPAPRKKTAVTANDVYVIKNSKGALVGNLRLDTIKTIHAGNIKSINHRTKTVNLKQTSSYGKNPIQGRTTEHIDHAARNFAKFHGTEATNVDKVKIAEFGKVAYLVGELEGVIYATDRDGKPEKYIHRFRKSSRPLLVTNHDGTQLRIIGGKYLFTEDGIVDK